MKIYTAAALCLLPLASLKAYAGATDTKHPATDTVPATALDEVVVTALGIEQQHSTLGYGVQKIEGSSLNRAGSASLASSLQGHVAGLEIRPSSGSPGASAQILIRGARSFTGNNRPLYVVDGMPVDGSPDFSTGNSVKNANLCDRTIDLDPDDIESVSVLKGQAAAALYGIRASNGVIAITTRRAGERSRRPRVTLSTDIAAEMPSRRFRRQTVYAQGNGPTAFDPNSAMTWGPQISALPDDAKYGGNTQGYPGQYYNPKLADAGLNGWTTPMIYDNIGDFFQTGITENTNIGISQRLEKADYSFGLNNSYQKGIVPTTGMNRWSARALASVQLSPQVQTGFSGHYSSVRITSAPAANSAILNTVWTAPAEYDLKGTPTHVPGDPSKQVSYRPTVYDNPYWWADNNSYVQHTDRFFGNVWLEWRPLARSSWPFDLRVREQAGVDTYASDYTDTMEVGSAGSAKGQVQDYGLNRNVFNNLLTAEGSLRLGDDWQLALMLGNEIDEDNSRWRDYTGSGFNFYGLPTMGNATSYSGSEYSARSRTVGFFGDFRAEWAQMLFLNVTGRNDYVSAMPRGHRSVFYPSVSAAWLWSRLAALDGAWWLDLGKLRLSYAQVGQAGRYLEDYYYVHNYSGGMYTYKPFTYPVGGVSSYVPYPQIYDPELHPQNTENVEAGVELSLFNGRLRAEYTLAWQNVTDQIFAVPTAGSTGYQYMTMNAGRMRTWSHEALLSGTVYRDRDWTIEAGVNLTAIDNKVVRLADGVESLMLGGFTSPQVRAEAGKTYPIIYGTAFKRDEEGRLLLSKGLPQATAASTDLGNCSPDFTLGANLTARWRMLSLHATLSWQHGGRMYHGSNMVLNYSGVTLESLPWHEGTIVAEGIDAATGKPNTVEVDRYKYYMAYYNVTESGVYDMSFVKLRDVTLTCRLPKLGPLQIDVFAFGRNILLWTKLPDFDPESSQGNGNMGGYFERFSMPATTAVGGGLKISF